MRVLADFHHHDLWESLAILFEDRFGWELYRPIGMEWFEGWYWSFERAWHGDAVARQYLGHWDDDRPGADCSWRDDRSHPGRRYRLVTLEQARATKFDFVIATVDHNQAGLAKFAGENGARFGLQLGNIRHTLSQDRWDLASFALVSTQLPFSPPVPSVVYRQEFSLEAFRAEPPPRSAPFRVGSFVNCFAENEMAYAEFRAIAAASPELDWGVYGSYGSVEPDELAKGNLGVCADVAAAMRAQDVIWHTKRWSDGYGHVIHNAFAVGRPVFGSEGYYRSQLAGPLWIDGVTSIDLDRRTRSEAIEELHRLAADPERHFEMSAAAAARFREVVDFDAEASQIAGLLERVYA